MKRLSDWLGQHQTALTLAGPLSSAICILGLERAWGEWRSLLWALGLLLAIVLPPLGLRSARSKLERQAVATCVKNALEACIVALGHPAKHVRANLMVLSSDGQTRKVDTDTAANMSSDPDCDIVMNAHAGVSGEAFRGRVPVYGDLALAFQPGGPTWGLSNLQREKVRTSLRSILSVPVFDPDDPQGPLLGTLQVDSDHSFEEMGFDRLERHAMVERFADVVALLLRGTR